MSEGKLVIEIDLSNEAFAHGFAAEEAGTLLESIAIKIKRHNIHDGNVRDPNGNLCGTYRHHKSLVGHQKIATKCKSKGGCNCGKD